MGCSKRNHDAYSLPAQASYLFCTLVQNSRRGMAWHFVLKGVSKQKNNFFLLSSSLMNALAIILTLNGYLIQSNVPTFESEKWF
jgi:hypothetical protein